MNFNYDLMTWIDYFIGSFACCFGTYLMTKILLGKNIKQNRLLIYTYSMIVLFAILVVIIGLIFDNVGKIIIVLTLLFMMCKFVYKQNYVCGFFCFFNAPL